MTADSTLAGMAGCAACGRLNATVTVATSTGAVGFTAIATAKAGGTQAILQSIEGATAWVG